MATFRQEMPPPGGYEPLIYSRIPLKPGWSNIVKIGALLGVYTTGFLLYKYNKHVLNIEKIEMRCSRIALQPLLLAEKDRMILKQLKKNRDDEEELMKDVPGWEVGKWDHNRVFLSVGPDEYISPTVIEYFVHSDPKIVKKYHNFKAQI